MSESNGSMTQTGPKAKARATPAEVLTVACPRCRAAPGKPCKTSYYPAIGLGFCVEGFTGAGIHTARYLAKVRRP